MIASAVLNMLAINELRGFMSKIMFFNRKCHVMIYEIAIGIIE